MLTRTLGDLDRMPASVVNCPDVVSIKRKAMHFDDADYDIEESVADTQPPCSQDGYATDMIETGGEPHECHEVLERRKNTMTNDLSNANFQKLNVSAFAAMVRIASAPRAEQPKPTGIVSDTAQCYKMIEAWCTENNASWSVDVKKLACGALACFRMRLLDISLREHTHLLYIILGDTQLRAHQGRCHTYDMYLGHWQHYDGLLSESSMDYVKRYLLRLEGFFRELPGGTPRQLPKLLRAMADMFGEASEGAVFARLVDNAIFNKGDGLLRKTPASKGKGEGGGKGIGNAHADMEVDPFAFDAPEPVVDSTTSLSIWHIIVAQTMCKVASAMQREILEGKLISYFTEWCNTASPRVPGVCYRDYIVVYDRKGEPTQYLKNRSPMNNIYIGIDADYLGFDPVALQGKVHDGMSESDLGNVLRGIDPVLISNIDRYTEAMSKTFWACYDGFQVQQACEVALLLLAVFNYLHTSVV